MAKATKPPAFETVDEFILQLADPFGKVVQAIRQVFLQTDNEIGEQIKWNAACFVYTGALKPFNPKEYKRDIAVVNVYKGYVLIVFPTGARIKDGAGLLEGDYTDGRRLAKIYDMKDLVLKQQALRQVLKAWLKGVEQ